MLFISYRQSMAIAAALAMLSATGLAAGTLSPGKASGALSIDGKSVKLAYSYAFAQPNTFDKQKTDIAVLLTESPLPPDALKNAEEMSDAVRGQTNYVLFEIGEDGKPTREVVAHTTLGDSTLQMSGFTNAQFAPAVFNREMVEGSFATTKVEEFAKHTYELKVTFKAAVQNPKPPLELPNAKTGQSLPAGGGEPWTIYQAFQAAMKKKDIPALKKMKSADAPDMPDAELKDMLDIMVMMMPQSVKLSEGFVGGDVAVLYLTGTMDKEKQYGTVAMKREGGTWKLLKESWSNTPPDAK